VSVNLFALIMSIRAPVRVFRCVTRMKNESIWVKFFFVSEIIEIHTYDRHSAQFASIQESGNGREWVCNLAVGRSAAFVGVFLQGRGVKKSAAEEAAADMALLAIEVRMWERACMIFISA
jgi:hypothetical protein